MNPILYHRTKSGAIQTWRVWTEGPDICTEFGQQGGKMQTSRKRAEPKNIGKTSMTTAIEQAEHEANAMWVHQIERKYSSKIPPEDAVLPLPMLAQSFYKKGEMTNYAKKLVFPADVQPKLDGVRCIAKREAGEIKLYSRSGKLYEIPHICEQLEEVLTDDSIELDGELYCHDLSLQQITSLVKRPRQETEVLTYNVYDVPRYDGEVVLWEQRRDHLWGLGLTFPKGIVVVKTDTVRDLRGIEWMHGYWVESGYEGVIVRSLAGEYRYGYRDAGLLKVKSFITGEFAVVDCEEGVGKDVGTATFVCRRDQFPTPRPCQCSGPAYCRRCTFGARMRGTLLQRREFWERREEYVGQALTVEYFQRTDDGVPQFPVGVGFRVAADA